MRTTYRDPLLHDPALFMRRVREAGLSEISIHIDTTQRGQERLHLCAFQVPIDGALCSMCEVNALGLRHELYANMRVEGSPSSELAVAR